MERFAEEAYASRTFNYQIIRFTNSSRDSVTEEQ